MCTVEPTTCFGLSKLEIAMDTMTDMFFKYASHYGDHYKLDFLELKKLIQTELSQYVTNSWNSTRIGYIMDDLDKNMDGRVSFEEFFFLISQIIMCRNPRFKDYAPTVTVCGQLRDGRFKL
nr:protein S100-A1-like [Solea senegalensis]